VLALYHSLRHYNGLAVNSLAEGLNNLTSMHSWLFLHPAPEVDDEQLGRCYRLWRTTYLHLGHLDELGVPDATPGPAGMCGVCCRLPDEANTCGSLTPEQYLLSEKFLHLQAGEVGLSRHLYLNRVCGQQQPLTALVPRPVPGVQGRSETS
jgi:hypothetical protein